MKSNWKKLEGNVGELTIEIEADVWKVAQKNALDKLAQNITIKGFRKGKAPISLLKKEISVARILNEAMDTVLEKAYPEALKENDVSPITNPELIVDTINEETLAVTLKIQVKPEVTLGEYKDLGIVKNEVEVTEEDIHSEINKIREQAAELVIKEDDMAIENGDTVVIDFEGFLDNVAFEGGKGENHSLEIGSGSFIPGFEEQLIGMKTNETKDITVTFPEEYQATDLAGKEAVFKVAVHEIKQKKLPEVDDELALDADIDGVNTLEELKLHITTQLANTKERDAENKYQDELFEAVISNSQVDVPDVMVENELNSIVEDVKRNITNQGLDFATYCSITNTTEEQVRENFRSQAEKRVALNLILEEVIKVENIEVDDEEVATEIEKIAEAYGEQYEQIKTYVEAQKDMIKEDLKFRKASDLIRGVK